MSKVERRVESLEQEVKRLAAYPTDEFPSMQGASYHAAMLVIPILAERYDNVGVLVGDDGIVNFGFYIPTTTGCTLFEVKCYHSQHVKVLMKSLPSGKETVFVYSIHNLASMLDAATRFASKER